MTVYFAQPNITLAEYIQVEFPKPDLAHNGSDTGIRIESDADVGVTVQIRRDDGSLDQLPPPVMTCKDFRSLEPLNVLFVH